MAPGAYLHGGGQGFRGGGVVAVGMGKGEGESKARGAELLTHVTKVIS